MRKSIIAIMLAFAVCFMGCATTSEKIDVGALDQLTPEEQEAVASSVCVLIGSAACAVKPEVAPPAKAVLDTVVAVNTVLTGDTSQAEDMEEWVQALQRSAKMIKKKSFQKHVSNLMVILQKRGVLNQGFDVIDLSRLNNAEVEHIMKWIRICADSLSIGLSDCVDGG